VLNEESLEIDIQRFKNEYALKSDDELIKIVNEPRHNLWATSRAAYELLEERGRNIVSHQISGGGFNYTLRV